MRVLRRAALVCALLTGAVAGWASGARPALECAEWVSTKLGDAAGVGHLTGTSTVTIEWELSVAGITYNMKEQFEVGTYDFGGFQVKVDCRTYTIFQL